MHVQSRVVLRSETQIDHHTAARVTTPCRYCEAFLLIMSAPGTLSIRGDSNPKKIGMGVPNIS